MNERILELASKAGIYGLARLDGTFENEAEVKKFAELIVRECAEVIIGNEIDHPITGAVYDGDQAKAIKKHFGVES